MRCVVLESPYAGNVERNLAYCRAAMHDCLRRGEAPFPSHALYTQPGVLDDTIPEERALGIEAGLQIGERMDATVVYVDLGISSGMDKGIARAIASTSTGPERGRRPSSPSSTEGTGSATPRRYSAAWPRAPSPAGSTSP